MKTYIAFLRGINVSGKKKIPMAELRELCESVKLKDVKTYIQSGNIIFKSNRTNTTELEKLIEKAILNNFGFEVLVLIKTVEQLNKIISINPFNLEADILDNKIYFVLLNSEPQIEFLESFKNEEFKNEEFFYNENCIYLKCNVGYGKAKLNNNLIERKLKLLATTRNYRTMNTLIDLSKA
tara:strand:+ start:44089 stop:44631 length:543 start_codon:yes stop_codon:yes gene_type:complete